MKKKNIYLIIVLIILLVSILFFNNKENFDNNKFDLVIPYGPNEDWIIQRCIDSCKKYI